MSENDKIISELISIFMKSDGQSPIELLAPAFKRHLPLVQATGSALKMGNDIKGTSGINFVNALQKISYNIAYMPIVLRSMPAQSAHLPDMEIAATVFLKLCGHYWNKDQQKLKELIMAQQNAGNMTGRLPFICLSWICLKLGDVQGEYEYGRKAYQTFSQCGASCRAYYDGWHNLKSNIPISGGG